MKKVILILFLMLSGGTAEAFHEVLSFDESANIGGGAGNYFTGSPRSKGYQCHVCHVGAQQRIRIGLNSSLSSGEYQPGLVYTIILSLQGEHKGLQSAFNPNTFAAEVLDADGNPVGRFAGRGVELRNDYTVAIAEGFGEGETQWEFSWWAPPEPVAATLYIAMLDGNGAGETERRFIDPLDDDVATLEIRLCPKGEVCPHPDPPDVETSPAGCSAAGTQNGLLSLFLLLLVSALVPRSSHVNQRGTTKSATVDVQI